MSTAAMYFLAWMELSTEKIDEEQNFDLPFLKPNDWKQQFNLVPTKLV